MFENAVALDGSFALAYAAIANVSAQYHQHFEHTPAWIERAKSASQRASMLGEAVPEILVAEAWLFYAEAKYDEAIHRVGQAIERKPDVEGGYYLLGRALFAAGKYQQVADISEAAVAAAGEDYNIYVPIINALGALGKTEARRNYILQRIQVLEEHLKKVPEDARGRTLLASDYAKLGRVDDALREAHLAMALRPDESTVMYNVACVFCQLEKKPEGLEALRKAWNAGFRDPSWARRDPALTILHDDPEFEKLYPADDAASA
jgi:tetratricopeptide (TPR) repeat protein